MHKCPVFFVTHGGENIEVGAKITIFTYKFSAYRWKEPEMYLTFTQQ